MNSFQTLQTALDAVVPGLRIQKHIGGGSFKDVFQIECAGKIEALKRINLDNPSLSNPEEIEDFENLIWARTKREYDLLRKFQGGPLVNIGSVPLTRLKVGNRNACVYSEEHLPGRTLDSVIYDSKKRLDTPSRQEIKTLFETGLTVIERLWSDKIIHRDIKPQNIMKTQVPGRDFVFFDLGIAFDRAGNSLTEETFGPGTLRYRAPETLDSDYKGSIDLRCDLFSLAVTTYEFATNRHPIHEGATSPGDTIYRLLRKNADPLSNYREDLSASFCRLIDRCLKKKPALRPMRFDEIRKGLEDLI